MGIEGPLSAQGERLFNQKGATVEANGDAIQYGVSYVDLPLLLHAQGPSLGLVTLYGLVDVARAIDE